MIRAALSKEGAMAKGLVSCMGMSLNIKPEGKNWGIMIRKADPKDKNADFNKYHDKAVTPADIKQYIPHFEKLKWKLTKGFFGIPELIAIDESYRIGLSATVQGNAGQEKLIAEFNEFMAS